VWVDVTHFLNLLLMMFIIRSGIQILADHPRLYWTRHSTPGKDWFRFQRPVPEDPLWTAKQDSVTGRPLSYGHGAPLRLRDEVQLGFKQVKWIAGIEFVAHFSVAPLATHV
jgi:hypothetical protein